MGIRTSLAAIVYTATHNDETLLRPYGGMLSPYTRHLVIDPGGRGDFKTIFEAVGDASDAGLSSSNRWLLYCMPHFYSGEVASGSPIDVPNFVTLMAPGVPLTSVDRPFQLHGRSIVRGFNIAVASPHKYAVKIVHDVSGGFSAVDECNLSILYSVDDAISGVENGGNNLVGELIVRGCRFDIDNKHAGVNAKTAQIRTIAGGVWVRAHSCQFKSTGLNSNANARHMCVWNQGTQATARTVVHGSYEHFWTNQAYAVYNENALVPGGVPLINFWGQKNSNDFTVPDLLYFDAHANAAGSFPTALMGRVEARGDVSVGGKLSTGIFPSPWGRTLRVDSTGKSDHSTIGSAINYAVSSGASGVNNWTIDVGPGTYVEDIELPQGIHLRGAGRWVTTLRGQMTAHHGFAASDLTVWPQAGATWWLHYIGDGTAIRGTMYNVHGHIDDSVDGRIVGVKVSGTTAGALQAWECSNQVENKSSGASADIRLFHIQPGTQNVYVEWFGGQIKSNSGSGTARNPELVWCQGTGASYVRFDGVGWFPAHTLNGQPASVRRCRGENPGHPGIAGSVKIDDNGNVNLVIHPNIVHESMAAYAPGLAYHDQTLSTTVERWFALNGYADISELPTAPAAPAANSTRLYAVDDGTGNTQLIARFATGRDAILAKQGGINFKLKPGERFTGPAAGRATAAMPIDVAMLSPIDILEPTNIDLFEVQVTASATGSTLRALIYGSDVYGQPTGVPIKDFGTLDTSTNGLKSGNSPTTLQPGRYWRAVVAAGGTPTIATISGMSVSGIEQSMVGNHANGYTGTVAPGTLALTVTGETTTAPLVRHRGTA